MEDLNNTPVAESTIETSETENNNDFMQGFSNEEPIEPETEETVTDDESEPTITTDKEVEADDTGNDSELDYSDIINKINKDELVKYNKETIKYDNIDDLIADAQKGRNYEKVHDRDVESRKLIGEYEKIAKLFDMEVSEFTETMMNQHFEAQAEENNTSKEFEKEKYNLALEKEKLEANKNKKTDEDLKKEENDKMFAEFEKEFPEVKEVPDEVLAQVEKGKNLLDAYRNYENKQLKEKLKSLETKFSNLKKSPTKATNGGEAEQKEDDFMAGFKS